MLFILAFLNGQKTDLNQINKNELLEVIKIKADCYNWWMHAVLCLNKEILLAYKYSIMLLILLFRRNKM